MPQFDRECKIIFNILRGNFFILLAITAYVKNNDIQNEYNVMHYDIKTVLHDFLNPFLLSISKNR